MTLDAHAPKPARTARSVLGGSISTYSTCSLEKFPTQAGIDVMGL